MAAGTAHVAGLFGKLPAHGDFVRRGGPAAVLGLIDRWLDRELGAVVATGLSLDDAVDALDGAHGAFAHDGDSVLAALVAGGDSVGRRFPLVATLTGRPAGRDAAAIWCAAAGDALATVRDSGGGADAALAAVAAITPPAAAPDAVTDWWRSAAMTPPGDALTAAESPAAAARVGLSDILDEPPASQTAMIDGVAGRATDAAPPANAPPAWHAGAAAATDQAGDTTPLHATAAINGITAVGPSASATDDAPARDMAATPAPADAALPAGSGPSRAAGTVAADRPVDAALPVAAPAKRWWRPARAAVSPAGDGATQSAAPGPALPTGAAFRALLAEGRR